MASDEFQCALESPGARAVLQSLWSAWPAAIILRPCVAGPGSLADPALEFVQAVQRLSDAGLIGYEALVIGLDGPRLVDAALTARGRATVGTWLSADEPRQQLAG
jgi:hypothetical protein